MIRERQVINFLRLGIAAGVSQGISLILMPIVTRLYSPVEYGYYSLFSLMVAFLVPVTSLCLPQAIILTSDLRQQASLARTSVLLCLSLASGLVLSIVLVTPVLFPIHTLTSDLLTWLFLLWIGVVSTVVGQVVYQLDLAQKSLSGASYRIISQASATGSLKIILGSLMPDGRFLALSQVLGSAVFYPRLKQQFIEPAPRLLDWSLLSVFKEFPIHQMPQQVLNMLSRLLPSTLLMLAFDANEVGYFGLALLALGVVGQVIGKPYSDALVSEFVERQTRSGATYLLLMGGTLRLALIGLLPFGFVFFLGQEIFSLIFSSDWQKAGQYAEVMALWLWVASCNGPALTVIRIVRLQRWISWLNFYSFPLRAAALFLGFFIFFDSVLGIKYYAFASLIHNLLVIVLGIFASRRSFVVNEGVGL